MLHMNRATLLGHAGRDPQGRDLKGDERTAWFTLATTRRWKEDSGAAVEKTDWHRVVVYGGAVKPVENMVRKGSLVLVEGRLATREYEDSKGIRRQVTEVVVAGPQGVVNVLTPKRGDGGPGGVEEPPGDTRADDAGARNAGGAEAPADDTGAANGAGDEDV